MDVIPFISKDTTWPSLPAHYNGNYPAYYAHGPNLHHYLQVCVRGDFMCVCVSLFLLWGLLGVVGMEKKKKNKLILLLFDGRRNKRLDHLSLPPYSVFCDFFFLRK